MEPVIAKPDTFFRDKEISALYKRFKPEIDKIREQEENERLAKLKAKNGG